MDLRLPAQMDAPSIPDSFVRGLKDIDPALVCYWNRFRNRFVVDRVYSDESGKHTTNVLIVETLEHGYMTPNQYTLDRIKAMDAWTNYGGNDEDALARMRKQSENEKAEYDAKQRAEASQNYRHGMLDDRVQINKALHLIQQHDVARVNQ